MYNAHAHIVAVLAVPPAQQLQIVSMGTRKIMPLPPRLQVHGPTHCATIKAIPTSDDITPNKEEKFTLEVTIRDAATGTPLDCLVGLQGDSAILNRGQLTCLLSLSVSNTETNQTPKLKNESLPEYMIWRSRKSRYVANGQVTLYMCFYEADTNYVVTLGVASVIDEEGIECMGHTVEHYTGFVSTYGTVERGTFKAPAKLKYEGELASSRFNELLRKCYKFIFDGKIDIFNMIMEKMLSKQSTASLDVKLYLRLTQVSQESLDSSIFHKLEDILKESKSAECRNAFLLEGDIMSVFAHRYMMQGNKEKALQCIRHTRSICLEAVPSEFTSSVFFLHARNLIYTNKSNITPDLKRRILELFDRCIADSYCSEGLWQRFNGHVKKALFCLNGTIDVTAHPTPNYTPTSEDISLAEQHLKAAPLEFANDMHVYVITYYIVLSDLYRWKGDKSLSREYVEKAKTLCIEKGSGLNKSVDARLELLAPDTIDQVLEELQALDCT